jgi:hypothetical protein
MNGQTLFLPSKALVHRSHQISNLTGILWAERRIKSKMLSNNVWSAVGSLGRPEKPFWWKS